MKIWKIAVMLFGLGLGVASAEFRGAWVASVHNINFPSKSGLSVEQQKREIVEICETARRLGLNALMVQVRPECDALYDSRHEPWSRYLTGTQGKHPGYDPLETFIIEGKKRGIGIHAWINPYRAAANAGQARTNRHITKTHSAHVRKVANLLVLDPSSTEVQDHLVRVVTDLVGRYPLAGVHLDDYFYPYPTKGYSGNFPDTANFERYRKGGGKLSVGDWRRQNVNTMVRRLHGAVKSTRPSALFGISPFGIYTKGQPPEVKAGLDQYNTLYADPLTWMREGWVDYLAPQLYWRDGGPQSFSALLRWWRSPEVNPRGVPIYPGIAVDRLGGSHNWPVAEIAKQLRLERSIGPRRNGGFILWDFNPLLRDTKKIRSVVAAN